jgi:hypothetical protein
MERVHLQNRGGNMKIPFEAILGLAFAAGWLCCLFSAALWAYFTRGKK